jgi:uncharacterized protein with von Willebrand factor type A (vWA) domain/WD40 repeat protein
MNPDQLPLLHLFTRLRQAGLPLGVNEYELLLRALQQGFGISDRQALARLCCTLWVKSREDRVLFNYHFDQVMAENAIIFVSNIQPEIFPEVEKRQNPIIYIWTKTSLFSRLVLGGIIILTVGSVIWTLIKPTCPYFISKPIEVINEHSKYIYNIQACQTNPNEHLGIKALQKPYWLTLKDNQNGKATLSSINSEYHYANYYEIRLWNVKGQLLKDLGSSRYIRFSNGLYLVTYNFGFQLWDIHGNQLSSFQYSSGFLKNFSPNGQFLVTKKGYTSQLWDIHGKQLDIFGDLSIKEIQFSPNGQFLVTISKDDIAQLWDIHGKQLDIFGNLSIKEIQFSPNGQFLATISKDDIARLWDVHGKQLDIFGNLNINRIEFSPNGQFLVTTLEDNTVRLWDVHGKQLDIFGNLNINRIEFSQDGKYLVTASSTNQVKLQVTDRVTGKSNTQIFSLYNPYYEDFSQNLTSWLIYFGSIIGLIFIVILPVGYGIARLIIQRKTKQPSFPPIPEPKKETLNNISPLNQGIEDEIQVAKAIRQENSGTVDIFQNAFTKTREYFPITSRQMKQSWRYLRRFIREGASMELDVEATVNQVSRQGMFLQPIFRPRRVNRNQLLLLVDQDGSMIPFHSLSERLADTAIQGGRLGKSDIYYFHNCPSEYLYSDPYHQVSQPINQVLSQFHPDRVGVLIFSDAGASRGNFNKERVDLTAEFLYRLRQQIRYVAWLNPTPSDRWTGTAGEIAKLVPMYELTRQGLNQAIDTIRGKPT